MIEFVDVSLDNDSDHTMTSERDFSAPVEVFLLYIMEPEMCCSRAPMND